MMRGFFICSFKGYYATFCKRSKHGHFLQRFDSFFLYLSQHLGFKATEEMAKADFFCFFLSFFNSFFFAFFFLPMYMR